jgi:hypothetical protein
MPHDVQAGALPVSGYSVRLPQFDVRPLHMLFFVCGSFVNYTAGVLNAYEGAILFVALTNNYMLRTMFQKYHDNVPDFNIKGFRIQLISIRPENVFRYMVSYGGLRMPFILIGVDVIRYFSPLSNVDFVHYL